MYYYVIQGGRGAKVGQVLNIKTPSDDQPFRANFVFQVKYTPASRILNKQAQWI